MMTFDHVEAVVDGDALVFAVNFRITECGPNVVGTGRLTEETVEKTVPGLPAGNYTLTAEFEGERIALGQLVAAE